MADGVFNIAKGEVKAYAKLAIAGSGGAALGVLMLKSAGLVADGTLIDYDDVATMLAGASDESTSTGYVRKIVTGGTIVNTVDDTNDRLDLDMPDLTWTAIGASGSPESIGKIVVYFRPATASADGACIPLTHHDFAETLTGSDVVAQLAAAGFYRAA